MDKCDRDCECLACRINDSIIAGTITRTQAVQLTTTCEILAQCNAMVEAVRQNIECKKVRTNAFQDGWNEMRQVVYSWIDQQLKGIIKSQSKIIFH